MTICCSDFYQMPITQFLLGESFHPGGLKLTQVLAEKLLIAPKTKVLDVACGLGESGLFLADYYGARVTGVDFGEPQITKANESALKNGLSTLFSASQANAMKLPFNDNSFDALICECAVCTFDEPEVALKEMQRVLGENGRIGISDVYLNKPLPDSLVGELSKIICLSGALSLDAYKTLLSRAGFRKIRSQKVDWAIPEMINVIRKQSQLLKQLEISGNLDDNTGLVLPDWMEFSEYMLDEMEAFIDTDGIGYMLMTAKA